MSKEGFLVQNPKSKRNNLSKYVSGKIKYSSKDRKKDLGLVLADPSRTGQKSRNQFGLPKYKTNDYHKTALGRFTKDAKLHKIPSSNVKRVDTSFGMPSKITSTHKKFIKELSSNLKL